MQQQTNLTRKNGRNLRRNSKERKAKMKYREQGIRKRRKENENKRKTGPTTTTNLQSFLYDIVELKVQNGIFEIQYKSWH
jgi:hypothetical protein